MLLKEIPSNLRERLEFLSEDQKTASIIVLKEIKAELENSGFEVAFVTTPAFIHNLTQYSVKSRVLKNDIEFKDLPEFKDCKLVVLHSAIYMHRKFIKLRYEIIN